MKRSAIVALLSFTSLTPLSCSSWNTGSASIDAVENTCLETVDTFARTAERCGDDYLTARDRYIRFFANGDCKNVTSIRDEEALRTRCLPSVTNAECAIFAQGTVDPTCLKQLQRPR